MSRLWPLVMCLAACRPSDGVTSSPEDAIRVTPSRLDFGSLFVGTRSTKTVTFQNPTRTKIEVELHVAAPFEAVEQIEVGGGDSVEVAITFTPTEATESVTTIEGITLTGTGLEVPACAAPTGCSREYFDFAKATCVEELAPEGKDCSSGCLVSAHCSHGECVGETTTCDDNDPCTIDLCTTTGCTHSPASCPLPDSLCEASVCRTGVGCTTVSVPDGTRCGARVCDDANVCINARCVSRPVPAGQVCIERMAGSIRSQDQRRAWS